MQQKVADFFASHPKVNEVYEALGRLFIEKDKAEKLLGGVAGNVVVIHTRKGIQFEKDIDKLYYDILQQTNVVNGQQLVYETAAPQDKESAMNTWKAEKLKLEGLEHRYSKKLLEEKKDAGAGKKEVEKTPEQLLEELKFKISDTKAKIEAAKKSREDAAPNKKGKFTKQIEKLELELDELVAQLPKEEEKSKEFIDHEVTQEDLDNNPDLVEQGQKVGDIIQIPIEENENDQKEQNQE